MDTFYKEHYYEDRHKEHYYGDRYKEHFYGDNTAAYCNPVGKIAKKVVCWSVFLTIWHYRINKNALLRTAFWRFCPLESL